MADATPHKKFRDELIPITSWSERPKIVLIVRVTGDARRKEKSAEPINCLPRHLNAVVVVQILMHRVTSDMASPRSRCYGRRNS